MKNWEEIFLTFEADCKQRNVPRMHILWLRAQCLICIKTDIEFPRGPEKRCNARSNVSAVTAMFWNSQSKKSNFLTWPDLAFGFAHPQDLGTRLSITVCLSASGMCNIIHILGQNLVRERLYIFFSLSQVEVLASPYAWTLLGYAT